LNKVVFNIEWAIRAPSADTIFTFRRFVEIKNYPFIVTNTFLSFLTHRGDSESITATGSYLKRKVSAEKSLLLLEILT
jgi:hypothetical protein